MIQKLSLVILTSIFLSPLNLLAGEQEAKIRVAYFRPEASILRSIYGNGFIQYQLDYSWNFCGKLDYFANIGYMNKHGHSIGEEDPTRLRLTPISTGLKYNFNFCNLCTGLEGYLGAGLTYSLLRIHDDSPFVIRHSGKNNLGWIAKSGLTFTFCNCGVAEIFLDYYYTEFHFSGVTSNNVVRNDLNLSGLLFGGGLGVKF